MSKQSNLKATSLRYCRILTLIYLHIFFLQLLLFPACETFTPKLNEKIQRVENGLLKQIVIKGQPIEKMKIAHRMEHHKVPGVSIAVINNFKIEWAKGYGIIEGGKPEPITTETLFQAASISKPVAAVASLRMVELGLLDIDEDINNKLVSWKIPENEFTSKKKVSLRRLLSHSAGVTVHGFRGYAQDEDVPTLVQLLDGEKPANSAPILVDMEPDTKLRYSGGGYSIMQKLLIDLKNEPFPKIMRETVLESLGMLNSTYEQPLPKEQRILAATAHGNNGKPIKGKWHTYPEMAAAGLWTTPKDLARFAIEMMLSRAGKSNKVLSKEMTNKMLTVQHGEAGLGLFLGRKGQDFSFSHGGSNNGFRCYLIAYPEKGQGAAIMTNGDNGSFLFSEILRSIAAEYGWKDFQAKEKILAEVDPEIYDLYVGQYRFTPDNIVEITKENKRLFSVLRGEEKSEIFPESETTFFTTDEDAQITFVKDAEGKVIKLLLKLRGRKMTAKKIE